MVDFIKKKVISVVGARPNFMKVAPIHREFQKYNDRVEHYIVHTGQHYDKEMSDAFFQDLEMPHPARFLGVGSASHAQQTAKIMVEFEKVLLDIKPDLVIVVGDVNSTIACALTAVKFGIKVAHVEAGLRSGDRAMPEEINRIATDSICDYCFVSEKSGFENLLAENFPEKNIFYVGNTMIDSQYFAILKAKESDVLKKLNLNPKEYILVTLHRPSNVDDRKQLSGILKLFDSVSKQRKVVFPVHPRTRKNINKYGFDEIIDKNDNLIFIDPVGYIDFLSLMMNCDFVITDSGGIQEETTALKIPCITARTTTERPITIEQGTNTLVNPIPDKIFDVVNDYLIGKRPESKNEIKFWDGKASVRIVDIILNKILT